MSTNDFQNPGETSESVTPESDQTEHEQHQHNPDKETQADPQPPEAEQVVQKTDNQSAQVFLQKTIVNIENGEKLGNVSELLFDPDELRVAALTTASGGLLNRETLAIPSNHIRVWGKDFILVEGAGESLENISPSHNKWLPLSSKIKGKQVISSDGSRLGQIEDLLIDTEGKIVNYRLSQVFVEGPEYESRHVPVRATHSLGKDALIINME